MAAFNKFNAFVEDLAERVHNLGADTLKVMLTNTVPLATNSIRANLTEISAGNGYTAGGNSCTISSSGQTAGVYKLVLADTPTSPADPLIGWYDYGAAVTLLDGETLTIDFDATNGVLTVT
jgi:hypothetical protein